MLNIRKTQLIPIGELKEYSRNAKNHTKEQIEALKENIQRNGFYGSIVIDKNKEIVIGHGRLAALKLISGVNEKTKIPCTFLEDLSEEEIKSQRIFDNKISEMSWKLEELHTDLFELKTEGFDLDRTGFDLDYLNKVRKSEIDAKKNAADVVVKKLGSRLCVCPKCGCKFEKGDSGTDSPK